MIRQCCWLIVAAGLLFAACGGDGDGDIERRIPVPGLLVFTLGIDLWIQDEDGARLWLAAKQDQQLLMPAISPDGKRVAFVVFQLTQAEGTSVGSDLAVADLDDPRPVFLFKHEQQGEFAWSPRWMPDGESLLFTYQQSRVGVRIERVDIENGAVTVVREDAHDVDISDDGSRLVFVNTPFNGDPHLVVLSLEDGTETVLDPNREWEPRPVRIPRFSSDGRSVVFSAGQFLPQVSSVALGLNGPEDIWSVDLVSGELTQLAAIGEDQPDFVISADGRHVLIMGAFGLYLVETPPRDPPYAIAPGEFHGSLDWIGSVSEAEWQEIRESVFETSDASP